MDQINWLDLYEHLKDVPQTQGMMSVCMSKEKERADY